MNKNKRNLINNVKDTIRHPYAWPGGYEKFGITQDGALLCCKCMHKNFKQILRSIKNNLKSGWLVDAICCTNQLESKEFIEENENEFSLDYCGHCGKILND